MTEAVEIEKLANAARKLEKAKDFWFVSTIVRVVIMLAALVTIGVAITVVPVVGVFAAGLFVLVLLSPLLYRSCVERPLRRMLLPVSDVSWMDITGKEQGELLFEIEGKWYPAGLTGNTDYGSSLLWALGYAGKNRIHNFPPTPEIKMDFIWRWRGERARFTVKFVLKCVIESATQIVFDYGFPSFKEVEAHFRGAVNSELALRLGERSELPSSMIGLSELLHADLSEKLGISVRPAHSPYEIVSMTIVDIGPVVPA